MDVLNEASTEKVKSVLSFSRIDSLQGVMRGICFVNKDVLIWALRLLPIRYKSGILGRVLRGRLSARLDKRQFSHDTAFPRIMAVIPCLAKDLQTLESCVDAIKTNSLNPISRILLVVPGRDLQEIRNMELAAQVIPEESLLPSQILSSLSGIPDERRGWILQQVLKLWVVHQSEEAGVLVMDADTILTAPQAWLDFHGRQILAISNEFHRPYLEHFSRNWGSSGHVDGLSFVTHHQLMQPKVVRSMLPSIESFLNWIESINDFESGASEYHDYGTYLLQNYPQLAWLSSWNNLSVAPMSSTNEIQKYISSVQATSPSVKSISMHSYNSLV